MSVDSRYVRFCYELIRMLTMTLVIKVRLSQFLCFFWLLLFKGIKSLKILLFLPIAINWKGTIRKFFSSSLIYITTFYLFTNLYL